MFVDAGDLAAGDLLKADLCVVGAGAAGIALAQAFVGTAVQVLLVESGGLTAEDRDRGIYKVTSGPTQSLTVDSKKWYFGGNTNHWAANCRPLDESDFEPREWFPNSGWPIRKADLLPYYARAQTVCGLPDVGWYDIDAWGPRMSHHPIAVDGCTLANRVVLFPSTRSFADRYGNCLHDAGNIRVLLRSQAVRLQTNAADRVDVIEIAASSGRSRIEAGAFVLAAGGVENARLLLCSNDRHPQGLGNNQDLVGRFFMEHWFVDIPFRTTRRPEDFGFYNQSTSTGSPPVWGQLTLAEEAQRRERTAGLAFWFPDMPPVEPPAAVSAIRRVLRTLKRGARSRPPDPDRLLRVQLEQLPESRNRITLSHDRDHLGQPCAELTLRLADADRRGHVRSLRLVADSLGLDGRRLADQLRDKLDTGQYDFFWHHMGTTRMHDDPMRGVVDRDCRVHGISNLYIAGSSVFPTSGTAPPTLTIVALALRLADLLRNCSRGGDSR